MLEGKTKFAPVAEGYPMFHFSTKSQTLESLRPLLRNSIIPRSFSFAAEKWSVGQHMLLNEISDLFTAETLIFRSSAANEDALSDSKAGVFESVPCVPADDKSAMAEAVKKVINSYLRHNAGFSSGDSVLVQPMVRNISMAGVVFTQDLRSGAPYYVINYDDVSGRHDGVTSGSDLTRTLLIHRGYERRLRSRRFSRLLEAVQEIEDAVATPGLDIEFIVNTTDEVYIVQVRPMAVRRNWNRSTVRKVDQALDQTREFIRDHLRPVPGIVGSRSLFGIMPDWNPVEMLGAAPRPLAVSLYRLLITDSVWAEARYGMGYRNMSGRPLLVELNGRPYIDVRESFNSFLPASVDTAIAGKLVDAWLNRLEANPELHDKVEFEVALTTHVPNFACLYGASLEDWGLDAKERKVYEAELKAVTCNALSRRANFLESEINKTLPLQTIRRNSSGTGMDCLRHAAYLLFLCRENGTRPFSVLARCAFISEAILRGFVAGGILSPERAQEFRASICTVLTAFLEDIRRLRSKEIEESLFFERYGHLRPGSYDILSPRYEQRKDIVDAVVGEASNVIRNKPFKLTRHERARIDALLAVEGYPVSAGELFDFMAKAIGYREEAKFRFTKALSQALEDIALWGEELGLSREELSYLRIDDVLSSLAATPLEPWEDILRLKARKNMEAYGICQAIHLPYLICAPDDVDIVPIHKTRPNFVTSAKAQGHGLYLTGHESAVGTNFKEAIVFIESADPGFDWIFAYPIGGLVTKYGGANSHMAIRCAELRIPAAIGCGEQLFESLKNSQNVLLDCGAEHLIAQRHI